jgi:hypothetical protein
VTHLRQIMLEELRRRNYAESTIRAYVRTVSSISAATSIVHPISLARRLDHTVAMKILPARLPQVLI